WVSSNYAAVACTDFPTCHGEWWPEMGFANAFNLTHHDIGPNYLGGMLYAEARPAIHPTHPPGALTATLLFLILSWLLWRNGLSRRTTLLRATLSLQVRPGRSNVLLHPPLAVAVAHNGGGPLLPLVTVLINPRLCPGRHSAVPTHEPAVQRHPVSN